MGLQLVRALGKRLLRRAVQRLPAGSQEAIFRDLSELKALRDRTDVERFYALAHSLNVVDFSVRGDYGVISQSISDRVVLPFYQKTGAWAREINERLVAFFSQTGGTYIDVGANIGMTTIPVAQNPNVQCTAIEPHPSNFKYLSKNVGANCKHQNVELHQLAAFTERKKLKFELSQDNAGDHRIRLSSGVGRFNEQERETIEVDAAPLDEIVNPKQIPIAIKIDTQGAEPYVLSGGTKLLANANLLIMEVWPYGIDRMGGSIATVVAMLKDNFDTITLSETIIPANESDRLREIIGPKPDPWFHFDVIAQKD